MGYLRGEYLLISLMAMLSSSRSFWPSLTLHRRSSETAPSMHMPAHLAVMLKESRFFPNEEYRLVADAQHGFDEDNDQTGLTYQLLKKFNI